MSGRLLWLASCSYLTSAPEKLSDSSGPSVLPEILWNFSHFEDDKRLRLAQNPHFYRDLPRSPTAYGGTFSSQPTEVYEGTIHVLTNNLVPKLGDSRRVFLELDGERRAFDNFWDTNDTLIFKGWDLMSLLLSSLICFQTLPEDSRVKRSSKNPCRSEPKPPSGIVWFVWCLRHIKSELQNTHRTGRSQFANC